MKDILSLDLDELKREMVLSGERDYRANQIFKWIYAKKVFDFSEMTDLSTGLRHKLGSLFQFTTMKEVERQISVDGTKKFLLKLEDDNLIETVVLSHPRHVTFCISSQVGCALNCSFCATGASGFTRDLSASEIVTQVILMENSIGRPVDNIVFMGMGEPFLNEANVYKAIKILHDPVGRNLGIRHFTISTAGIPEGIKRLADSGMDVRLSVSLHSASDEKRSSLMPVNKNYPLDSLRRALDYYQKKTGNRITFEYALIKGVNDSKEDLTRLVEFLMGMKSFVNIIPVNPVKPIFARPSDQEIASFSESLKKAGFECAIRHEKGTDIDAACGQLRQKRRG